MTEAHAKAPAPISERALQEAILQAAELGGWLAYHTHDSRRSAAGFPDLVLVREAVVFLELKSEQGRLTPAQIEWIDRLHAAGEEAYVIRPADLDATIRMLTTRPHVRGHPVISKPPARRLRAIGEEEGP